MGAGLQLSLTLGTSYSQGQGWEVQGRRDRREDGDWGILMGNPPHEIGVGPPLLFSSPTEAREENVSALALTLWTVSKSQCTKGETARRS